MTKLHLLFIVFLPFLTISQFGTPKFISTDSELRIENADGDGDGSIDVVSISSDSKNVIWFKNDGLGNFSDSIVIENFSENIIDLKVTDFDNDGDNDIFIFSMVAPIGTKFIENIGNGMFLPSKIIKGYVNGKIKEFHDFNNDNQADIITFQTTQISKIVNDSIIVLSSIAEFDTFSDLTCEDFDLDGDIDIIVSTYGNASIYWYPNNGNGTFSSPHIIFIGLSEPQFSDIYVGDLDGDQDLDVAQACQFGIVLWHENKGSDLFQYHNTLSGGGYPNDIIIADLDNDSDNDILISHRDFDRISWMENLGNGTFSNSYTIASSVYDIQFITISDYDNDNDLDVSFGSDGTSQIDIFGTTIGWLENFRNNNKHISGKVFIDENQNSIQDTYEVGLNQILLNSNPASDYTFSYQSGEYFMNFSDVDGTYYISPSQLNNWSLTTDSSFYTVQIDTNFTVLDSLDFGFYPSVIDDSLKIDIVGSYPRCNSIENIWLNIKNVGTSVPSGIIHLKLNDSITYLNSMIIPDSIIAQDIYWSYDSLYYFSTKLLNVQVLMPNYLSIGNDLTNYLTVDILESNGNLVNTYKDSMTQQLLCAYDPNDKISNPNLGDSLGFIPINTETIDYTIRFQNTGNDTASIVLIKDQLDENFIWSSLNLLSSSHDLQTNVNQSGEITFLFNDISLPDSTTDFIGSQGYVSYSIKLKSDLIVGTSIYNSADIYFDFNPEIQTNCTKNTIYDNIAVDSSTNEINNLKQPKLLLIPNPCQNQFEVSGINVKSVFIYNSLGKLIKNQNCENQNCTINTEMIENGFYVVQIISNENIKYISNLIIE